MSAAGFTFPNTITSDGRCCCPTAVRVAVAGVAVLCVCRVAAVAAVVVRTVAVRIASVCGPSRTFPSSHAKIRARRPPSILLHGNGHDGVVGERHDNDTTRTTTVWRYRNQ